MLHKPIFSVVVLIISASATASSLKESALPSLQEETKRIHTVLLSEPTENDGRPAKQDQFSATLKIAKAVLLALATDQKLVFVGKPESFTRLTKEITDTRLLFINAKPYMWLQDLVEFGNSESGLMSFISYGNSSMLETVRAITRFANPRAKEPYIKILKSSAVHGTTGGNIEKWPGEIGVLGSSDFQSSDDMTDFARQIFSKETLLQLPTSWLSIGHLDELVKPLRFRAGNNCELELLINSPQTALRLLEISEKLFRVAFQTWH